MSINEVIKMVGQLELFLYGPEGLGLSSEQKQRIEDEIDRWNLLVQTVDAHSHFRNINGLIRRTDYNKPEIRIGLEKLYCVKNLTTYQIAKTLKHITL